MTSRNPLRTVLRYGVLALCFLLIGLLLIPAAILALLIAGVWTGSDRLLRWIDADIS